MFCHQCGAQVVGDSPKFCSSCGAPIAPAQSSTVGTQPEQPRTCSIDSCSASAVDGSNFCEAHGSTAKLSAQKKPVSPLVCPHCHVKGKVSTSSVKKSKGISGGKAAGAVVTGGLSIWLTGLSRKEQLTQAKCGACGLKWTF